MPIKLEKLPDESIICASLCEPFDPEQDVPVMFAEFIPLRMTIQGPVALILDVDGSADTPDAFTKLIFALAEASRGVRASREAGLSGPPITIFVGSGIIMDLASQAMAQEQYGGVRGHLCATREEALALAREKLSAR